jgi:hypothetical protein
VGASSAPTGLKPFKCFVDSHQVRDLGVRVLGIDFTVETQGNPCALDEQGPFHLIAQHWNSSVLRRELLIHQWMAIRKNT